MGTVQHGFTARIVTACESIGTCRALIEDERVIQGPAASLAGTVAMNFPQGQEGRRTGSSALRPRFARRSGEVRASAESSA
jgi:hypothetical protein